MTTRVVLDPVVVRRHNDLADLYLGWPGNDDPDDDPEFVDAAREIMGLPPLGGTAIRAAGADVTPGHDEPDDVTDAELDEILAELGEDDDGHVMARALDGDEFEAYWTRGKGLGRWMSHPHPWTRLRNLLRAIRKNHGRGPRDPEGLASTYFRKVFGYWPGHRKGDNPVGPG